jgi:hypothetical protein
MLRPALFALLRVAARKQPDHEQQRDGERGHELHPHSRESDVG